MASEWPRYTIQSLIDDGIITAHKDGNYGAMYPRQSEFGDTGVLFLTAKLVSDHGVIDFENAPRLNHEKAKVLPFGYIESGDVLLSHNATVGRVAVAPKLKEPVLVGTSLTYYRTDNDRLIPEYLAAYFTGIDFQNQLKSVMGLSTRNQVPITTQRKLDVVMPPLPEQKEIADILGSLDDKIELNRRMNETLEELAQALFKSWFVDFDPVIDNALEVGTPIPEEFAARAETRRTLLRQGSGGQEALADGTANRDLSAVASAKEEAAKAFPSAFQETDEMGWIPEGWELSTIGDEVDSVGGATPSTKNADFWDDGDIHWTTPKDLSNLNSRILLDTGRKITEAGLNKISSGLLPVDTVLMSSRAPVGYLALAKVPVAVNQGYIAMKCTKQLTPEYVIQWADSVMDDIKQRAGGTTFAEISKKNFRGIPVIVPESGALEIYSQTVKGFYGKITGNLKESRQLERLRDTLLPKLISGELRVKDAKEIVGNN